jgi:hypothetical protein
VSFSDDGSCSWRRGRGALDVAIASDYFVDRSNGDRVVAVAAQKDEDAGTITPQSVYLSTDGGATYDPTPLYTARASANVVSIEIARSDPDRIYIAMYDTPGRHPKLVRSDNGGQTWTELDVEAGIGAAEFRILAVDPDDPDLLYLRVIAFGAGVDMESVAVTRNGGATFSTPLTVPDGTLSGFVRTSSGTVLVAALVGTQGVAFRSTDRGATFVPWVLDPQPHIVGLAERDGVVYLAGKNYTDNWALASSDDEGVTISPLMTYDEVRGIKSCAQAACELNCHFEVTVAVWTSDVCTGALLDGGADAGTPPSDPGCGCGIARGRAVPKDWIGLFLVPLAGFFLAGRRPHRDRLPSAMAQCRFGFLCTRRYRNKNEMLGP